MDNVPLHRTQAVREALERLGVSVPTFPAYSPDLNPIEQAIAKLKAHLRKLAPRSPQRLTAALRDGLQQFTPAECAAFLRHSGTVNLNGDWSKTWASCSVRQCTRPSSA